MRANPFDDRGAGLLLPATLARHNLSTWKTPATR